MTKIIDTQAVRNSAAEKICFHGAKVHVWHKGVAIQKEAMEQIGQTSRLPFVNAMAVMPDAHYGMGASIGTVIHTVGAVIPSAVGVDIGCGVLAFKTDITADDLAGSEEDLRQYIMANIPTGRTENGGAMDIGKWGTNRDIPKVLSKTRSDTVNDYSLLMNDGFQNLVHPHVEEHLGTLGTGNHFIEVARDEDDFLWILVHSGSRGPGAKIASYWMRAAKEMCRRWFVPLEDWDLAYIPSFTPQFGHYWKHTHWAVNYAALNRRIMALLTFSALRNFSKMSGRVKLEIDTSHNFIEGYRAFGKKGFLTRKGASKSEKGQLSVMPGSMGTKSYIVEGLGNHLAMDSCSHGAGRIMSRNKARGTFSVEDHTRATEGVYCDKTQTTLDETPAAYKDIDAVLAAQSDLVEVKSTLRAFINIKG